MLVSGSLNRVIPSTFLIISNTPPSEVKIIFLPGISKRPSINVYPFRTISVGGGIGGIKSGGLVGGGGWVGGGGIVGGGGMVGNGGLLGNGGLIGGGG